MNKTPKFKPGDLAQALDDNGVWWLCEIVEAAPPNYGIRVFGKRSPDPSGLWCQPVWGLRPLPNPDTLDIDALAGLVPSHVLGTLRSERAVEGAQ